jgi:hypothetical protein
MVTIFNFQKSLNDPDRIRKGTNTPSCPVCNARPTVAPRIFIDPDNNLLEQLQLKKSQLVAATREVLLSNNNIAFQLF